MDYRAKYIKYKTKYTKLQNKLSQTGGTNKQKNTIYLFKAVWCGHCKAFMPTWEKLQKEMGKKVNFVTYDSDANSEEIKKYGIEGFPTIILQTHDKAVEYVGPRDENSLIEFINQYA